MSTRPRMLLCLAFTLALLAATVALKQYDPAGILAVTFYKAHMMALGGWGGYWLDRELFPYARPDRFLEGQATDRTALVFACAQLRRAIIVAACVICVGLGA